MATRTSGTKILERTRHCFSTRRPLTAQGLVINHHRDKEQFSVKNVTKPALQRFSQDVQRKRNVTWNGHIHHKYNGRFKSSSTSSQSWSKEKTFIQAQDVFAKLENNTGKLSSRSSSTRTSLHRRWVPAQQPSQSTKTQSALP